MEFNGSLSLKDFYRIFRSKEKQNYDQSIVYAKDCIKRNMLPESQHWKVFLEMADAAKRANKFAEARGMYRTVLQLQRHLPHGWVEYAKMEEECGRLHSCSLVLREAEKFCVFSETLISKAMKHHEKLGQIDKAREIVENVKSLPVSKTWKILLEAALLEAKIGNYGLARHQLNHLMQTVPWCGPVYFEAARLEEKLQNVSAALSIVEKGLASNSRFGTLWFLLFRLSTYLDQQMFTVKQHSTDRLNTQHTIFGTAENSKLASDFKAVFGINSTLFKQRFGVHGCDSNKLSYHKTKNALQKALGVVSREVLWKVFFEAAQVFQLEGNAEETRNCYVQAGLSCPANLRWKIWLAGARTEICLASEQLHDPLDPAKIRVVKQLLNRALDDVPEKNRSLVLLEVARFQEFMGQLEEARKTLQLATLTVKSEWKVFLESVLLEIRAGKKENALEVVTLALKTFAGTGRLWAMKVHLASIKGHEIQKQTFSDALKEVPKSGEVWCEGARMHMNPLSPSFNLSTAKRYLDFAIQFTPQYGDSFLESLRLLLLSIALKRKFSFSSEYHSQDSLVEELKAHVYYKLIEVRCINADPNYGTLWFHCKSNPLDPVVCVLERAVSFLVSEMRLFSEIYKAAVTKGTSQAKKVFDQHIRDGTQQLVSASFLSKGQSVVDFSTGITSVAWIQSRSSLLSNQERLNLIFGADALLP